MPECTCRGGNPNCFKCNGWGWIGGYIHTSSSSLSSNKSIHSISENRKTVQRPLYSCCYCNKKVANLDHHVSVTHPNEWLQYSALANVKNSLHAQQLSRCVECGALVRNINIKNHLEKIHGLMSENT